MTKLLLIALAIFISGCLNVSVSESSETSNQLDFADSFDKTWDISGPSRVHFAVQSDCPVYWATAISSNGPFAVIVAEDETGFSWKSLHQAFTSGIRLIVVNVNAGSGTNANSLVFEAPPINGTVTLYYEGKGELFQTSKCEAAVTLLDHDKLLEFMDHQDGVPVDAGGAAHQRTYAETLAGSTYEIAFSNNSNQEFAFQIGEDRYDSSEYDSYPSQGNLAPNHQFAGTWTGSTGGFWLASY